MESGPFDSIEKFGRWKPELWMVLEFWSWNKNDSEYFHFHQFWAKRDLPV